MSRQQNSWSTNVVPPLISPQDLQKLQYWQTTHLILTFVASDLLSQAEHGPDSQVLLVTDSEDVAARISNEVDAQLEQSSQKRNCQQVD